MIGTLPSFEELLKITIRSSGIEKLAYHKICQNKLQILPGQGEDLYIMQFINEGISMRALPLIILHNENCSWRMYMDSRAIKYYIHCLQCRLGHFCWSLKYSKMSLKSPYHQIIINQRGEYNKGLHALAIRLLIGWTKCHNVGETTLFLRVIVRANDIISEKEKITARHDLTKRRDIHQVRSYRKKKMVL